MGLGKVSKVYKLRLSSPVPRCRYSVSKSCHLIAVGQFLIDPFLKSSEIEGLECYVV